MTGRPNGIEAPTFHHAYIQLVKGDDALVALQIQLDEMKTLLEAITEEKSQYRYEPEKWSIRQVLNHVTDAGRMFGFRLLYFPRGFKNPLPSFDPGAAATTADANRIAWSELVEEFRQVRLGMISLIKHLPLAAWTRSGMASEKSFTVRALAFIIPGHAAHHMRILHEVYLQTPS